MVAEGVVTARLKLLHHGRLLAILLLCGCSRSGPSASDIKAALQDEMDQTVGKGMASTVENITDLDCREAQGRPGFVCSYKFTLLGKTAPYGRSTQVGENRFIQSGSAWVVIAEQ